MVLAFSFLVTFLAVCMIYFLVGLGLLDEDDLFTEQNRSVDVENFKDNSFSSINSHPRRRKRRVSPKSKNVFSPLLLNENEIHNISDRNTKK